ncbi:MULTISPECIES: MinD/ParA family ATP-binding protein [Bacteria]|uniref:MinD/ParA family ATP-binding protein n=1 Tax=Bacteria TaxID=2 RepID=UPI003C7DB2AF
MTLWGESVDPTSTPLTPVPPLGDRARNVHEIAQDCPGEEPGRGDVGMQAHKIEVDAAGVALVDGVSTDFAAAVQKFAAEAAAQGGPVLVESTDLESGVSWFMVDAAGRMTAVEQSAPTAVAGTIPDQAVASPSPAPVVTTGDALLAGPALSPVANAPVPQLRRNRPTAADFAASQPEPVARPAEEGLRGGVNRLSGGALRLQPGRGEIARREARASVHRGLAGSRTMTVMNLKGGAGKTSATYLIAATLGRVRGGNILAWDNNENKGTLADRSARAGHDHTAVDVLEHLDRFRNPATADELSNFVRRQGDSKFDVLASQNVGSDREVIDGEAFAELHAMLRSRYHLLVVDTGNASTAGTWQAAAELGDTIVLTAMNKEDSLKTAMATIDVLVQAGYAQKLARSVLLLTQPAVATQGRRAAIASQAERLQRTRDHCEAFGIRVVEIPFDPSLDDGSTINYEALLPQTREAYLKATALIVDGL